MLASWTTVRTPASCHRHCTRFSSFLFLLLATEPVRRFFAKSREDTTKEEAIDAAKLPKGSPPSPVAKQPQMCCRQAAQPRPRFKNPLNRLLSLHDVLVTTGIHSSPSTGAELQLDDLRLTRLRTLPYAKPVLRSNVTCRLGSPIRPPSPL